MAHVSRATDRSFTDLKWVQRSQPSDSEWEQCSSDFWVSINEDQSRSESSTSTWTSDEGYEKEVGERVGRMLDAIDCRLYEGTELPEGCKGLEHECQCWIKAYPHLRITGSSLDIIKESNNKLLSFDEHGLDEVDHGNEDESWSEYELIPGLQVVGTSVHLNEPCKEFSEELIEVDGTYEELLAFDNRDGTWPEDDQDNSSESELERNVREELTLKIWQKVISKLLKNITDQWSIATSAKVSPLSLPSPVINRNNNVLRSPSKLLVTDFNQDLQSILTISSKTLLNRNVRPPSVHTRTQTSISTSTVSLRLGSPQRSGTAALPTPHSACNRRLAPLESGNQLFNENYKLIKGNEQLQTTSLTLTKHFPALPPIERSNMNNVQFEKALPSPPGLIQRTLSESKSTERVSVRLNSGSRLPIPISRINLGSLSSGPLNTIIDYPRSANWMDRASSGRIINRDNRTANQHNSNDSSHQLPSSGYQKLGKSDIGSLLEVTKPKFWI